MQKQNTIIRKNKIVIMMFLIFSMFFFALPFLAKSTVAVGDVPIDATNFPDPNFRTIVKQYDKNRDNVLQQSEIQAVTEIDCKKKQIADLKGIEHFTALTTLYCDENKLTALDVSKNTALSALKCNSNQLTALDVSHNTALTDLICHGNKLTSLDVSKNTVLTKLDFGWNQLTAMDVSKNTALTSIYCSSNQLTTLDVSKNTALTYLSIDNNKLTSLDVRQNTALTRLYCYTNQLTSLDVSKNTSLKEFRCGSNQLTALDVRKNTSLKSFYCSENKLTSLDVRQNTELEWFECKSNRLTSLDVSKNTSLYSLNCSNNQLTAMDVSKNAVLGQLFFDSNKLTSLNVRQNTALKYIGCKNNQITSLDVSKNPALGTLNFSDNQLTALDVSQNTALENLNIENNKLTSLDVRQNTALKYLKCSNNQLTALDVSKNTKLENLNCYGNHLSALDFSRNTLLGKGYRNLCFFGNQSVTIKSSIFNNGNFVFNIKDLPGVVPSKVKNLTKKDGTALPSGVVYDSNSGTLTVSKAVAKTLTKLKYIYDHSSPTIPDTKMDVILTLEYPFVVTLIPNNSVDNPNEILLSDGASSYTLPNCSFTAPTGKKFKCWKVAGAEKQPGDTINVTENIDVDAVWESLTFTVTYKDENGNTVGTPQTVEYGQNATAPAVPQKPGYTGAWDNDGTNITSNRTINAVYTPNINNVTFDPNGGNGTMQPMTVTTGQSLMLPTCTFTPPTGKVFDKWEISGTKYDAGTTVNGIISDTVVKATWTTAKFTVTYKDESGNVIGTPQTVEYGQNATPETVPAKTGYTGSWSNDGKNVTSDLVITPIYKVITFTVTYKADGVVVDTQTVNYGQNANAPQIPPKPGYTATGWDNDGTNITSDRTINAKYTANVNNVTFNPNGGNGTMQPMTVTTGQSFMLPTCTFTPPTGKVFDKWEIDGTKYDAGATVNGIISDTVVKATWTTAKFTVTFIADGKVIDTQVVDYGEKPTVPPVPKKPGYDGKWDYTETITGDRVINAVYTAKVNNVTFDSNGGNGSMSAITVKTGDNLTLPTCTFTPPTGKVFDKWEINGTKYDESATVNNITSDTVVKATWKTDSNNSNNPNNPNNGGNTTPTKPNNNTNNANNNNNNNTGNNTGENNNETYKVKIIVDGRVVDTQIVKKGEKATLPPVALIPPKEGYIVVGWDNDGKNITADTQIHAVYKPDPNYKKDQSLEKGKFADYLANHPGMIFVLIGGIFLLLAFLWWLLSLLLIGRKHTVEYMADGKLVSTQKVKHGENTTVPLIPQKDGYTAIGWDNDGTNIKSNITINAKYRENVNK